MLLQTNHIWLPVTLILLKICPKHAFWPKSQKRGIGPPENSKIETFFILTPLLHHISSNKPSTTFSYCFFFKDIKFSLNVIFYIPRLNSASSLDSRLHVEMACNRERHDFNLINAISRQLFRAVYLTLAIWRGEFYHYIVHGHFVISQANYFAWCILYS